jgi:hypothetical protein
LIINALSALYFNGLGDYLNKISGEATCPGVNSNVASITSSKSAVITNQSPAIVNAKQQKAISLFVSVNNATSYQWRKNGIAISGATSSIYSIGWVTTDDYATYDVIMGSSTPCGNVTSSPIEVKDDNTTTSVKSLNGNISGIRIEKVYPNPTSENAKTLVNAEGDYSMTMSIYNALGMLISKELIVLNSGSNELNIYTEKLAAGKYLIKLDNNTNSATAYLVVIK